jgi:cob(I)alamin adenosyltransferase
VKIYTGSGDRGQTALFGGERVAKTHPRVAAYGTVDELNAALGLAAVALADPELSAAVETVQARLFDLGADLATPAGAPAGEWLLRVPAEWAAELEADIDRMTAALPPLTSFVLPGGGEAAARLHLARTVCRRAERALWAAVEAGEEVGAEAGVFLNRLGDWLFTAARLANHRAGIEERPWARRR